MCHQLEGVSPNIRMLKPNPKVDGIWRWGLTRSGGQEGGAPVDRVSVPLRDPAAPPRLFCTEESKEQRP